MIDMHSKYDNMYKNRIFDVLICINNHIITCIDCMLLMSMADLVAIGVKTRYIVGALWRDFSLN